MVLVPGPLPGSVNVVIFVPAAPLVSRSYICCNVNICEAAPVGPTLGFRLPASTTAVESSTPITIPMRPITINLLRIVYLLSADLLLGAVAAACQTARAVSSLSFCCAAVGRFVFIRASPLAENLCSNCGVTSHKRGIGVT